MRELLRGIVAPVDYTAPVRQRHTPWRVRAAEGRAVLGRRRHHAVTLVPVPSAARPAVIRSYLLRAGRRGRSWGTDAEARHYFGVGRDPSDDELRRIADRYPVFLVRYAVAMSG